VTLAAATSGWDKKRPQKRFFPRLLFDDKLETGSEIIL